MSFDIDDRDELRDELRRVLAYETDSATGRRYVETRRLIIWADAEDLPAPDRIEIEVDGTDVTLVRNLDMSHGQNVAYEVQL
jgi:hypothetical protein